jgi:hypothetical protein
MYAASVNTDNIGSLRRPVWAKVRLKLAKEDLKTTECDVTRWLVKWTPTERSGLRFQPDVC